MRNFSNKVVEKIKIHILSSVTSFFFFWKIVQFEKISENYGGARGRKWQYDGAWRVELVRLHARKHKSYLNTHFQHACVFRRFGVN
jgi:hypothetical protein